VGGGRCAAPRGVPGRGGGGGGAVGGWGGGGGGGAPLPPRGGGGGGGGGGGISGRCWHARGVSAAMQAGRPAHKPFGSLYFFIFSMVLRGGI